MQISFPEYYKNFRCIASDCPDSCCKEWTVDVDDESAALYRSLSGALGDRLRQVLQDTDDGIVMTISDGRCPMWQEDGLCRIQAELGHDALCQTCRDFPRLRHDYGDFVELGLELSCPEAARLIFSPKNQNLVTESIVGGETPEYDEEVMSILLESRKIILDFLNSESVPLSESLAVILLYSHSIQSELDGGEKAIFDPMESLEKAKKYAKDGDVPSICEFFLSLEILTKTWKDRISSPLFYQTIGDSLRPLARYMIQRYWLQAISDLDLVCRVKFAIVACLLVNALGQDPVETAQLFSKEIENDPDNVEAILDAAYSHPAFTDVALLGSLLVDPKS